jgi:hypothetical protein
MRALFLISLCLTLGVSSLRAGVTVTPNGLFVEGIIDGDLFLPPPFDGDTIDYLTFEVTETGPVRLVGTNLTSSVFCAMAEILPEGDFVNVPPPYRLFDNYPLTTPPEFTRPPHSPTPVPVLTVSGAADAKANS